MKRGWTLAVLLALLLTGCGREPDQLALVRVLGADGGGPVELTAVCGGTDQQNGSRGACRGENLDEALALLPWSGEEELSLTSVSYLVVGEDADLRAILFTVLEDERLGTSATIWLSVEGAGALLAECEDPASYLALLTQRGVHAPTVAQALAALCTDGRVTLPVLAAENGQPAWKGETVWEDGHGK